MLSDVLSENYQVPERILIDAMSVFDDEALEIAAIDIDAQARVTGMEFEDYKEAAYKAEQICPISNALRGNLELRFNAHNFGYGTD